MINLGKSIFDLAILQLQREGIYKKKIPTKERLLMIIDRAVAIRKYLDMVERNRKVAKNRKKRSVK